MQTKTPAAWSARSGVESLEVERDMSSIQARKGKGTQKPDADKAADFVTKIRPKGLIKLVSIHPETQAIAAKCFEMPGERDAARDWIAQRDGKRNLYLEPNPPKRREDKRSKEPDIAAAVFAYVDCDPINPVVDRKTKEIIKPGENPIKAQKRHHERLHSGDVPPPSIEYVSGGGTVALWRHKTPIRLNGPESIDAAKRFNVGLAQALGGKAQGFDSCQSQEHLYRIANTTNIPDARKRAKGRVVTVAGDAVVHSSRRYTPDDFPEPISEAPKASTKTIGDADDVDIAKLKLSPRSQDIFENGSAEDARDVTDDSASGWRMALINSLKREGKSDEVILGVLMHPDCMVATEKRSTDAGREKLYRTEIAKATAFREANGLESDVSAEEDFDDAPDIPDEGEDEDNVNDGAFDIAAYEPQDPTKIPRREWLYGTVYIRKFIGLTAATGGAGKSSLILVEAVAMACGKNLLGVDPVAPLRVLYWNGEDPQPELDRRVEAILKWFKLTEADLGKRLFVKSGRDLPIRIAEMKSGAIKIAKPMTRAMVRTVRKHKLDVVAIDPFVSSHGVPENDNTAMEVVAKKWADIADKTNCAVILSHHTRKTNGGNASIEDSRGASALNYAARTRRAINTMTATEAKAAGITDERARLSFFKADMMGSSMMKPTASLNWYRFESVDLMNGPPDDLTGEPTPGDSVGVVVAWEYKAAATVLSESLAADALKGLQAAKGPWPAASQSPKWLGNVIAELTGLDLTTEEDKKAVRGQIAQWLESEVLVKVTGKNKHGRDVPLIGLSSMEFPDDGDMDFG